MSVTKLHLIGNFGTCQQPVTFHWNQQIFQFLSLFLFHLFGKQDVVTSLRDKLCLSAEEHFSLVLEHVKSLKRNKLTLLDPDETLARVSEPFYMLTVIIIA